MDEILKIISEILDVEKLSINQDTKRLDLEEWDSLAHIQIVMELESRFNIKIPFEEVIEINEIRDIVKYIK